MTAQRLARRGPGGAPPTRPLPPAGMDRRTFLRSALAVGGAAALGACSPEEGSTGGGGVGGPLELGERPEPTPAGELPPSERITLRLSGEDFGIPSPFDYIPPNYGRMILIYDTLLAPDATGEVVPWLAGGHEVSEDRRVHTFQLREGAQWHDGRPVTAEDVVFSFDYFVAQRQQGTIPGYVLFGPDHVADMRATGERTVEVRLERPAVTFARNVAGRFPIVPRHVWADVDEAVAATADPDIERVLGRLVGSGPYRLESYSSREGYLFTANDGFYLGAPFVKRLEMAPVGDELSALQAGELDAGGFDVQGTSAASLRRFVDDPDFGVIDGPHEWAVALYWNLGEGAPFDDVRFRRACAHALDRQGMVTRLLDGNGVPGSPGFLPPSHPYHADVRDYPYDPDRAEQLLEEAGYRRANGARRGPDGEPLRVSLTVSTMLASAAELVVAGLEAVGVEVAIDPTDQFMVGGDYQMAMMFYGGVQDDPDYLREIYSTRVAKPFHAAQGYANDEVDDLADRQLVTAADDERRQLVARLQQQVAADLPLLHLYYPTPFMVYRKGVFDQWAYERGSGGPFNKQTLVTGTGAGGTEIRRVK